MVDYSAEICKYRGNTKIKGKLVRNDAGANVYKLDNCLILSLLEKRHSIGEKKISCSTRYKTQNQEK